MLTLEKFSVAFESFTVEPLTLRIDRGERVALVGPNGAGKSTTMRALSGRLPEYTGEIRMDDREIRSLLPAYRASVGLLPEKLLGLGWMSVAEHMRFLAGFYPTWDDAYARALIDRLELPDSARVGTLSKGMAVKLSFACAEAFRPPVLLLDEPTSGLDPLVRRELLHMVREICDRDPSRVVLFSTHILEDVSLIADRVIMLLSGRLVGDETVAALSARAGSRPLSSVLYEFLTGGEA